MKVALDRFRDFARKKGLKMTRQRTHIVKTFLLSKGHRSAEELYQIVKEKFPEIGLSTVYRTLHLLREAGLAYQVDFDPKKVKFEKGFQRQHHDHLVCTSCGRIVEFLEPEIETLQDRVAEQYNFKLLSHRLEMFGLCSACQ